MSIHPVVKGKAAELAYLPPKEVRAQLERVDWRATDGLPPGVRRELAEGIGLPSVRTIQDWVATDPAFQRDDGRSWTLADAGAIPPSLVLESLRAVVEATGGAVSTISKAEAAWINRVGAAAPDLSPWMRYQWARLYAVAARSRKAVPGYDLALAFAPWRGGEFAARYMEAIEHGIPEGPSLALFNTVESPRPDAEYTRRRRMVTVEGEWSPMSDEGGNE